KQTAEMLSFVHTSLQSLVVEPFATEQSVVNYAKQLVTFWAGDVSSKLEKIAYQQIPGAKYLEIKGGSHYLHYEDYELLTDIINRFLKETWTFTFDHAVVNQTSSTLEFHGQAALQSAFAEISA